MIINPNASAGYKKKLSGFKEIFSLRTAKLSCQFGNAWQRTSIN